MRREGRDEGKNKKQACSTQLSRKHLSQKSQLRACDFASRAPTSKPVSGHTDRCDFTILSHGHSDVCPVSALEVASRNSLLDCPYSYFPFISPNLIENPPLRWGHAHERHLASKRTPTTSRGCFDTTACRQPRCLRVHIH